MKYNEIRQKVADLVNSQDVSNPEEVIGKVTWEANKLGIWDTPTLQMMIEGCENGPL